MAVGVTRARVLASLFVDLLAVTSGIEFIPFLAQVWKCIFSYRWTAVQFLKSCPVSRLAAEGPRF